MTKIVKENILSGALPTWDELYSTAPPEIKDYIDRCSDTPQGT
jgi:hypothetical protein